MKKVLLLNPPGKRKFIRDQYCSSAAKADYYWPAVDLLVLSGILSADFDIEFIDAIAQGLNNEIVCKKIENKGFSAIISLASCASFDQDIAFFKRLKTCTAAEIIVNGGIFRDNPKYYLEEYDCIDAVITDYIKTGIVDFLKKKAGPFSGLWYKYNSHIVAAPEESDYEREFAYPVPRHELLDLNAYRMPQAQKRFFSCCLISYGCKYNCRYCSSSSISFRLRSIDNIIAELKYFKKLGIEEVHFPDFTFNASREHCLKVARAMLKEKLDLSWDCLARIDGFDLELAQTLKQAGLHTVQFGIETHSEKLRDKLGKPIKNDQIRQVFSICKKLKIQTIGFFMVGLPGQDQQSIVNTIDFACELDCDWASFSIFVPDAGSAIARELVREKPDINYKKNFDRTDFPLISNGVLSKKMIWQLRNKAIRRFYLRPAYIIKQMRKIKSFKNLKSISKMGISLINKD